MIEFIWLGSVGVIALAVASAYGFAATEFGGWGIVAGMAAFFLALAVIIVPIANASQRAGCRREAHMYGTAWQYHGVGGCYLSLKGHWVPDGAWIQNTGN